MGGFKSRKNGELLRSAEIAGYDALLTVDQGIQYQQNPTGRKLAIISVRSRTNQQEDLLPMVPAILEALGTVSPGQVVAIPVP